ncbi:MAG: hypothetical protein KBH11_05030 [Bacteroidia bacterium]|nr:hypothetical protein [Bacteroidota bacterium]MBK8875635.1 hypothetical protein [Bacteroidota bacterium]MBP9082416.1 hypothetical protein [Bacteroidia bacterium]
MKRKTNNNQDPLRNIISANMLEKPSANFTDDIMSKLGIAAQQVKYEPVISKNGWYFISFLVIGILYLVVSGSGNVPEIPVAQQIDNTLHEGIRTMSNLFESSALMLISLAMCSVFILVYLDSIYRQNKLRTV